MSIWFEIFECDEYGNWETIAFTRYEKSAQKLCKGFSKDDRYFRTIKQTSTWEWMSLADYQKENIPEKKND